MIAKIIVVAWTLFIGYAFLDGVYNIGNHLNHMPADGSHETAAGFAIMASMIVHFFIWLAVAFPTYLLSRMFQRRKEPVPLDAR